MEKTLLILTAILVVLISIAVVFATRNMNIEKSVVQFNSFYEKYLDKQIMGSEVATLIGKAINNNDKYNIPKDENGNFILDDKYSLEIYVKLYGSSEYYEGEKINKLGIAKFIENYNNVSFTCKDIKYHDNTKRVSKIIIEELIE